MTAAVIAAVRHKHTEYDELLAHGMDRTTARQEVADKITEILEAWRMERAHAGTASNFTRTDTDFLGRK